jgi:pyridoxamine 5'-phosphate oxidase
VPSRDALEARLADTDARYPDAVPRPAHWGGYRVAPRYWEFWQGGPQRLHDRLAFTADGDAWRTERLAP